MSNISVKLGILFKYNKEIISTASNIKSYTSKELKKIKPKIISIIKGLESENILRANDEILKIGKTKIKNIYDFFKAKNKINWNSNINIQVKRNRQILNLQLRIKSFQNWKKKHPVIGIQVKKKGVFIVVSSISMLSSALPEFLSDSSVKIGDMIHSIDEISIDTLNDYYLAIQDMTPGKIVNFKIMRDGIIMDIKIRIINFNEFIKLNRKFCKQHWPKNVSSFLVKKYEDNDFYLNEKYKLKILKPHWTTKQLVKTYSSALKKGRFKLTKKGKLGTKFIP